MAPHQRPSVKQTTNSAVLAEARQQQQIQQIQHQHHRMSRRASAGYTGEPKAQVDAHIGLGGSRGVVPGKGAIGMMNGGLNLNNANGRQPGGYDDNGGLPKNLVGCTISIPRRKKRSGSVDGLTLANRLKGTAAAADVGRRGGLGAMDRASSFRGYYSAEDEDLLKSDSSDSDDSDDDDSMVEDDNVSDITWEYCVDRRAQLMRRCSEADIFGERGTTLHRSLGGMSGMGGMMTGGSTRNLNLNQPLGRNVNLRRSLRAYGDEEEDTHDDDDDDNEEEEDTELGESKNRSEAVVAGSIMARNRRGFGGFGALGRGGRGGFGGRGTGVGERGPAGGRGLSRAMSDRNMLYGANYFGKQASARFLMCKRSSVKEEEEHNDDAEENDKKGAEDEGVQADVEIEDKVQDFFNKKPVKVAEAQVSTVASQQQEEVEEDNGGVEDEDHEKPTVMKPFGGNNRRASAKSDTTNNKNTTSDNNNNNNNNNNTFNNHRRPASTRRQDHNKSSTKQSLKLLDSIIDLKLELAQKQTFIDQLSSNYSKLSLENEYLKKINQNSNSANGSSNNKFQAMEKENAQLKKENEDLKIKLATMEKLMSTVNNKGLFPDNYETVADTTSISDSVRGSLAGSIAEASRASPLSILSCLSANNKRNNNTTNNTNDAQDEKGGLQETEGEKGDNEVEEAGGDDNNKPVDCSQSTRSTTSATKSVISRSSRTSHASRISKQSRTSRTSSPEFYHRDVDCGINFNSVRNQQQGGGGERPSLSSARKQRTFSGSLRGFSGLSGLLGLADEELIVDNSYSERQVTGSSAVIPTSSNNNNSNINDADNNANDGAFNRLGLLKRGNSLSRDILAKSINSNADNSTIQDSKSGTTRTVGASSNFASSFADSLLSMTNIVPRSSNKSTNSELLSDWGEIDTDTDEEGDHDIKEGDDDKKKKGQHKSLNRNQRSKSGNALSSLALEEQEEGNSSNHPKSFNQWFANNMRLG